MNQADATDKAKHSISELEKLYTSADEFDKELFAEQRSNILLVCGDHYNKLRSNFFRRLRDSRSISSEQKIRLTKNHIQKIADTYVNNIISTAPGVGFEAANKSELSDQKAAELNESVWEAAKNRLGLDDEVRAWCEDYVHIGEVATKCFWDPTAGTQKMDPMTGQPMFDELGSPVFTGDLVFEELFGFNLLIDPTSTNPKKAKWMCIRKMVDVKDLKKMFPGEENAKFIQESSDQTFTIFDRGKGGFQKAKDQCLLREFYFRPCFQYPNGYSYFCVKEKILFKDELPAGEFPIRFRQFRRMQTKARGQSIIKTLRPFQVEINRASSKIAEHQITLGDDKLITQNGAKVTQGASLPGVRTVSVTGMAPTVLPGRDGSQYQATLESNVSEMYDVAMVEEGSQEQNAQLDVYSLLFRAASDKKKFKLWIKGFESFLTDACELYLTLARYHFPDDAVIQMVGRKEQVNMAEFRGTSPLCYKIKVSAQAEDIETKLGKQLMINHTLQYVGNKLDPEQIGKLIKTMPYANDDMAFDDMTLDYESATNDVLALDRGEQPPFHPEDNHVYMIKRLTNRMRKADFQFMPPPVQQNYAQRLQAHEEAKAQQLAQIQSAEAGFIPTGGYLTACDFYVQPKDDPKALPKRVRLPSEALQWLIQKLDTQGSTQEELDNMNQQNLAEISSMMPRNQASEGMTNGQPGNNGSSRIPA